MRIRNPTRITEEDARFGSELEDSQIFLIATISLRPSYGDSGSTLRLQLHDGNCAEVLFILAEDSPDRQDPLAKYWVLENIAHNRQASEHVCILQDTARFHEFKQSSG
jgi:hypothetical protein